MAKKRVHEIAKSQGMTSKEVIAKLQAAGLEVKAAASSVDEADALKALGGGNGAAPAEAPAKPAATVKPDGAATTKPAAKAPAATEPRPAAPAKHRAPPAPANPRALPPPADQNEPVAQAPANEPDAKAGPAPGSGPKVVQPTP